MWRERLSTIAKAIAGLVLGTALWWTLAEPYTRMIAGVAETVMRTFERPAVTRLQPSGAQVVIDRSDFQRGSPRPALGTAILTVNFVLLTALFASNPRSFETTNVIRYAIAALLLVPVHIAAVIVNVNSIYALRLGPWSIAHYNAMERNIWGAAAHSYTLLGGFGCAFLLWWLLKPSGISTTSAGRRLRRKRSKH